MSDKKKLLLCIPDFPFPARKNGISIRYYPILENAAKSFDIHLIAITNSTPKSADMETAKSICSKVSVFTRTHKKVGALQKIKARFKSLIPNQTPFDYVHYDEQQIANFIKNETAGTEYDVALSVLITHQKWVRKYVSAKRHTLDVIDSPYSTRLRTQKPGLLNRYDSWMVRKWEQNAVNSCDYACYISPLDKAIALGDLPAKNVGIIPNGLYLQDYSTEKMGFGCTTIGYLGNMAYPPNIRAAIRLYRIFKTLSGTAPDTKLVIIGRTPAAEIQALAEDPNVIVTGSVDNIWPYVNGVDAFVFPMEIGSGQQNKLLETMGAGKPVISTELGNSGIGAQHNEQLIVANTDAEIAQAVTSMLSDAQARENMGFNAREFVNQRYSWESIFSLIDQTLLNTKNNNIAPDGHYKK
ncbi:glycosyltransferase family 4 protein [Cellvibrio sp. OA-2007]|uniref:glycosyltransferase family 4 protein n=1 Tax=Cellvibrio sp. OA-2007 TaxID=529823 RepID=UPI0007814126|nr:glycosyltransferase family 4 protein [Cellvibrio sp. OA-2007]